MSDKVFQNQALDLTLTAKDNDGTVINLTAKTVHFLSRNPDGTVTTDTSPTIDDPTNGQVKHTYATNDLSVTGHWFAKVLIDGDEIPSTRFAFTVFERWAA